MTEQTDRLWAMVDAITQPTRRKVGRGDDADWLDQLAHDPTITVCDVTAYRAATVAYGSIPSLWDQATWALTTGSEAAEGGGRTPLRERSPADLDLMETMLTIRESMAWQLKGRHVQPKPAMPEQMRQLASLIIAKEPQNVEWWAFRFEQWGRLLAGHLRAVDRAPKPVRLRNAPCPICKTRQVIEADPTTGERVVLPPLLIDFEHGWIRAARCTACGMAWWRGNDLGELAGLLDTQTARDACVNDQLGA